MVRNCVENFELKILSEFKLNNELCHKGFGCFFGFEGLTDTTAIFHELDAIATATLTGDFLNVCHG